MWHCTVLLGHHNACPRVQGGRLQPDYCQMVCLLIQTHVLRVHAGMIMPACFMKQEIGARHSENVQWQHLQSTKQAPSRCSCVRREASTAPSRSPGCFPAHNQLQFSCLLSCTVGQAYGRWLSDRLTCCECTELGPGLACTPSTPTPDRGRIAILESRVGDWRSCIRRIANSGVPPRYGKVPRVSMQLYHHTGP